MLWVFWTASKTSVIVCFCFLIQLLIRMTILWKSYVHYYSISFIRYKVTVMVLVSFVFPSWITNKFLNSFSTFVIFCFVLVVLCSVHVDHGQYFTSWQIRSFHKSKCPLMFPLHSRTNLVSQISVYTVVLRQDILQSFVQNLFKLKVC